MYFKKIVLLNNSKVFIFVFVFTLFFSIPIINGFDENIKGFRITGDAGLVYRYKTTGHYDVGGTRYIYGSGSELNAGDKGLGLSLQYFSHHNFRLYSLPGEAFLGYGYTADLNYINSNTSDISSIGLAMDLNIYRLFFQLGLAHNDFEKKLSTSSYPDVPKKDISGLALYTGFGYEWMLNKNHGIILQWNSNDPFDSPWERYSLRIGYTYIFNTLN